MKRLISILHGAIVLVVLAGLFSLYLLHRPHSTAEVWAVLAGFLPRAVAQPLVVAAAAGWLVASLLARRRGRPAGADVGAPRVHRVTAPPRDEREGGGETPLEAPGPLAAAPEPVRRERERDRLRLRLEAFLRGEPAVPAFVDELLAAAMRAGASDVHLEPGETTTRVAFRLQGELEEVAAYDRARHQDVLRRLGVLAGVATFRPGTPQDGRLTVDTPHGRAEIRLSLVPTRHGDKAVLRLAGDAALLELEELGLLDDDRRRLETLLAEPQGLVVLTGPTGSGKTTTLYSALAHVNRRRGGRAALAAIEDPVEIDLPFVQQTQVDRARDLGFVAGLRAILRQDPDVLMVGEVRDLETARVAVQAGLTGHLVLTSLHADSALGVFPRLIDLGVEPFLAASATLACVSQRLGRRLCPECRRPAAADPALAARFAERGAEPGDGPFFVADGCRDCGYEGVAGRRAVFEVLSVSAEVKRAVAAKAPIDELRRAARDAGARTLLEAAVDVAAAGELSLDEAWRVAS